MVAEVTLTYRIPSQSHCPIRYGSKTRRNIPRLPTVSYSMCIKTHHYSGHTYSNYATLLSTVAGLNWGTGQPWSTHRTLPHVAAEHHATGNNLPMLRYAIRNGSNSPQQKRCDMLIQEGVSCMKCLKL